MTSGTMFHPKMDYYRLRIPIDSGMSSPDALRDFLSDSVRPFRVSIIDNNLMEVKFGSPDDRIKAQEKLSAVTKPQRVAYVDPGGRNDPPRAPSVQSSVSTTRFTLRTSDYEHKKTWMQEMTGNLVFICEPQAINEECEYCNKSPVVKHLHMSNEGDKFIDPTDQIPKLEDKPLACDTCESPGQLFRCSSCNSALYCNSHCQMRGRFTHRNECKATREEPLTSSSQSTVDEVTKC